MKPFLRYLPLVLGLFLLCFAWLPTDVTAPNERSRIYLAVSLVDHQTLSIDDAIERFGPVFDRAQRDGRTFTDKAPGSSLLAAAVYGVSRLLVGGDEWSIAALLLLMRFGLMIPLTVAGLFLLRRILRDLGLDPPVVEFASLAWLVATPVLHYGQAFYGHQIVAVALLGAVACLLRTERTPVHLAIAGACAGVAGLTEYQAAIPCVLLALWVLTGPSRKRPLNLLAFFAAAAPFVAVLLAYHNAAFGGPFELSYHHLVDPDLDAEHTEGIGGVVAPSREALFGASISLHRGLLTTAPIMLLALAGIKPMIRCIGRHGAGFIGAIIAFFCVFIISSNHWYAGWSYGPRLLVPMLAVATIPLAFGLQWARESAKWTGLAVAGFMIGLGSNLAMKLTFFEVPPSSTNPLIDIALPALATRMTSPSLATSIGLSPALSLAIAAMAALALALLVTWRYVQPSHRIAPNIAVGISVLFFAFIYVVGPSWDDAQGERFWSFGERVMVLE